MSLKAKLEALLEVIASKPMLTRQDLQRRYGVHIDTIDDWRANGTLPAPVYLPGSVVPLWRPIDIERNESRNKKLSQRVHSINQ